MIPILAATFMSLLSLNSYATMAPGFEQDSGVERVRKISIGNQKHTDAVLSDEDLTNGDRQAEEENDRRPLREADSPHDKTKSNKEP